jgi:hypothetical protein
MVLTAAGAPWSARADALEIPRVRSSRQFIRDVIDQAIGASPTFRRLVAVIGATDGIVYVEEGVCRHGVRACLSLSVTRAAGFRFLRVLVDVQGASTHQGRLDLMGTIGHELWHALEVLSDRTLTTAAGVFQFYAREAPTANDAFETAAAVSIGYAIRSEVGDGAALDITHVDWPHGR